MRKVVELVNRERRLGHLVERKKNVAMNADAKIARTHDGSKAIVVGRAVAFLVRRER